MGKRSRESTNKSIDVVVMPGLPIVKLFTRAGGEDGDGGGVVVSCGVGASETER